MTRASALFLMVLLTGGCAADPPADVAYREYRRDLAQVEAYENFVQLKRDCSLRGGAVMVDRRSSPRIPPSTTEMRMATCSYPH